MGLNLAVKRPMDFAFVGILECKQDLKEIHILPKFVCGLKAKESYRPACAGLGCTNVWFREEPIANSKRYPFLLSEIVNDKPE